MTLKSVAYMCRWTFSEIILEANLFVWKFSVIERKHRFSGENVFLGLSKANFKCPVQYVEKKMIKVNFTFCGLFRISCIFLCSERKLSQGFQKHKLSAQRKNLGRNFLTQMLSQNNFLVLSRESWSYSGKLPAWLSYLHFTRPKEHFPSNVFGESL